jgi:hypothetical protein
MKKLFSILLSLSLIFLVSVSSLGYDKTPGQFKEFSDPMITTPRLGQSIVDIVVTGSAIGTVPTSPYGTHDVVWKFTEGTFGQAGVGYIVGNYIITAAHVVIPREMMIQMTDSGFWGTHIVSVKKMRITIGKLNEGGVSAKIFYLNREDDLAILTFEEPWLITNPLGYKLAESWGYVQVSSDRWDKRAFLNSGDAVAMIVRKRLPDGSRDWTYEVRYGAVITNRPSCPITTEFVTGVSDNDFVMDMKVYPGDSGSPIFAFKNGVPIVVGVLSGMIMNDKGEAVSYASKVDFVKRIVEIGR